MPRKKLICPSCGSDRIHKHGIDKRQKKKTQRYKCYDCKKTFGGGKVGRPKLFTKDKET